MQIGSIADAICQCKLKVWESKFKIENAVNEIKSGLIHSLMDP